MKHSLSRCELLIVKQRNRKKGVGTGETTLEYAVRNQGKNNKKIKLRNYLLSED